MITKFYEMLRSVLGVGTRHVTPEQSHAILTTSDALINLVAAVEREESDAMVLDRADDLHRAIVALNAPKTAVVRDYAKKNGLGFIEALPMTPAPKTYRIYREVKDEVASRAMREFTELFNAHDTTEDDYERIAFLAEMISPVQDVEIEYLPINEEN